MDIPVFPIKRQILNSKMFLLAVEYAVSAGAGEIDNLMTGPLEASKLMEI